MKKTQVRLSDKSQAFIEAKAEELQKTESEVINELIEKKIFAEQMKAAKEAKKAEKEQPENE
jgi:predicted DNA-binding protein